jgi:hypothetical protein
MKRRYDIYIRMPLSELDDRYEQQFRSDSGTCVQLCGTERGYFAKYIWGMLKLTEKTEYTDDEFTALINTIEEKLIEIQKNH